MLGQGSFPQPSGHLVDLPAAEVQALLESCFDEIFITDERGTVLAVSPTCERFYGVQPTEITGRSVRELERKGVFSPSATLLVMQTKQREIVLQRTATGRRLLVTATPVSGPSGEVIRIVSVARDVTELTVLRAELAETRELLLRYQQELAMLRSRGLPPGETPVAASAVTRSVFAEALKAAEVDCNVLLLGESGTGKDFVARYIHSNSHRKVQPFVSVNCAAIPEPMAESELFGYEPGAFTGSKTGGKQGFVEAANGGTLFLDEVAELTPSAQAKLLRAVETKQFYRLGGTKPIDVNVRIIAATNVDIESAVRHGDFRRDLYFRLAVLEISIPPLREHPEDIFPHAQRVLERVAATYGLRKVLSEKACQALLSYPWPGNVRELENAIESATIMSSGPALELEDFPRRIRDWFSTHVGVNAGRVSISGIIPLREAVNELERQLLLMAKQQHSSTRAIARVLGLDQSTVVRKLRRLQAGS